MVTWNINLYKKEHFTFMSVYLFALYIFFQKYIYSKLQTQSCQITTWYKNVPIAPSLPFSK